MVTAQTSFLCASWHWLKYEQNRTMDREWTWPLAQSKPLTLTFDLWLLTLLVYSMNKMGPRLERIWSQQWLRIETDIWPDLKTYFKATASHLLKSTLWIKGREIGSRQGFYLQLHIVICLTLTFDIQNCFRSVKVTYCIKSIVNQECI